MARARKVVKKTPAASPKAPTPGRIGKTTDIQSVRMLVRLMVENELNEIDIKDADVRVHLKRGVGASVSPAPANTPSTAPAAAAAPPADELIEIKSPMVGTYYSAPSPETEPYAAAGTPVTEDTVVCIIEAMKVMNEIKAECAGTIAEICVRNAQPVEYGQTLFRVRPT